MTPLSVSQSVLTQLCSFSQRIFKLGNHYALFLCHHFVRSTVNYLVWCRASLHDPASLYNKPKESDGQLHFSLVQLCFTYHSDLYLFSLRNWCLSNMIWHSHFLYQTLSVDMRELWGSQGGSASGCQSPMAAIKGPLHNQISWTCTLWPRILLI